MRNTTYPIMEQVESATPDQILRWNRFLPSAECKEDLDIINRIFDRYKELSKSGEINSNTSKQVGWDQ